MNYLDANISGLLERAAATLDLPAELEEESERQYHLVGHFLSDQAAIADWEIYPQGSVRLGTVVRPIVGSGGFDLDMVCKICISQASTTQAELKDRVGEALGNYINLCSHLPGAPTACKPSRRAWTLYYPSDFHMDVLPAIPDEDALPTGIRLTDKDLREWQRSDPIAYADWFRGQMQLEFERKRRALAAEMRKSVEDVPEFLVRTTLQRVVQILKRHRDVYFLDDLDDRPPSILITTLAARAYQGEDDLLGAVLSTVACMPSHITVDEAGRECVMSPVADENFADKWNDYPDRKAKLYDWLRQVTVDLEDAQGRRGFQAVVDRLGQSLGEEPMVKAARSLGVDTRKLGDARTLSVAGAAATLTRGGGTQIRPHRFYGD
jgi:hypothetical protein